MSKLESTATAATLRERAELAEIDALLASEQEGAERTAILASQLGSFADLGVPHARNAALYKRARELLAEVVAGARAAAPTDTERLEWWFRCGLTDSVCEGSVDLWWADDEAECERVTHGTTLRETLDKAMRGEYERD